MEFVIILWVVLIIIIFIGVILYLFIFKSPPVNLVQFFYKRKSGIEKSKYYQDRIITLEKNDDNTDDPIVDLMPPMSLIPLASPPNIPNIPTQLPPILPEPKIPDLLDKIIMKVPHPWSDDPTHLGTIKEEMSVNAEHTGASLITTFGAKLEDMSKKIEMPKNLKLLSDVKKQSVKKEVTSEDTKHFFHNLKYYIGIPIVIGLWYLVFKNNWNIHFYFLPISIYLLIIGTNRYLNSGLFLKPINSYTSKVVDQNEIHKSKTFFILAYIIELIAISAQTIFDFSQIATLLGYILIGICIFTSIYGVRKKNRYIVLISIYVIGIEIVAKLYDVFSRIFTNIPFWSYILLGAIILMDITFIVLSHIEKNDEKNTENGNKLKL